MTGKWLFAIHKVLRATSFVLLLKGAVAGSVSLLALFGIAVPVLGPIFGIHAQPSAFSGGVAAGIGAILGVAAAARA
jgi:hypothetical protein